MTSHTQTHTQAVMSHTQTHITVTSYTQTHVQAVTSHTQTHTRGDSTIIEA